MVDKVQQIKEEIERRIEQCYRVLSQDLLEIERKETNCCLQQYKELLQFIDSLPEEHGCEVNFTTKSEDLEIEIENYINSNFSEGCDGGMLSDSEPNLGGVTYCDLANLARHFAEWQKKKDQETI